jgi:chromosome segregation ATPase
MPDWLSIILALGGALSGLAALLAVRHEARKAEAQILTAGAGARMANGKAHSLVLQNLQTDYQRVNEENESLHEEVTFLRCQADETEKQVSKLRETLDHALHRIGDLEQNCGELQADNRELCAELGRKYNRHG